MLRTRYSDELTPEKDVKVAGWVHEKRVIGSLIFIVLRDAHGTLQVTAKKGVVSDEVFEILKNLKNEEVVFVHGEAVANKTAKSGVEVIPKEVRILSKINDILPIDLSKDINTTLEKRLDARCIDLRTQKNHAIFVIQSTLIQEMQKYLSDNGFMQVFTPCLMGVASESGAEVFTVNYFDRKAFLRQDPQLHRQLAIAGGFEKIYDVGPSWRAEASHTTRHLCEHRTIAVETAYIENEYDVMKLEQDMIIFALTKLQKDCKKELEMFNVNLEIPEKFPVLNFPELYDILEELGEHPKRGVESYGTEGEKLLGAYVKKKYNSDFFFVNHFPFAEKPFYVMRDENDPTYARSTDFIFRGVELSSGGQREHRYEKIMEQARLKGMSDKSVSWFADFFKYGVPPHGGFAIGIERFTKQILGIENVRETTLFPRDTERLTP